MDRRQFVQQWVIRHGKHEPGEVARIAEQGATVYDQLFGLGFADNPFGARVDEQVQRGPLAVKTYTQGAFTHPTAGPSERPQPPEFKRGHVPTPEEKDQASLLGWTSIYNRDPSPKHLWWLNQARRRLNLPDEPGEMEEPPKPNTEDSPAY